VFRQASIYVSHAFLGVSIQDKFIYLDSDTRLLQRSALVMRDCPATALVDVKVVDEYVRNGVRAGVTLDMSLQIQGETAAHKRMGIRWLDETSWNRMRAKAIHKVIAHADPLIQLPAAAQPSLVGRAYAGNVVVGGNIQEQDGALTVPVIVDQGNAGIFDHQLDHIPGMLLLEAFRQTALIAANRYQGINPEEVLLSRCQVRFTRFGEFGLATTCRLTSDAVCLADDQETVLMSLLIEQDGQAIATASLELSALAGSAGVRLTEPLTLTQTQTAGCEEMRTPKMIWFDFGGVLSPPIPALFQQYQHKTGLAPVVLQQAMRDVAAEMKLPMLAPVENAVISEAEWGDGWKTPCACATPRLICPAPGCVNSVRSGLPASSPIRPWCRRCIS
jgi:hypothetical protein